MLKVAICDDEKPIQDYLEQLVCTAGEFLITKFSSAAGLLKSAGETDILLLDIGMDGINGVEAARQIRKDSDAIIIFITALEEYVYDAFDVNAFHYLLKPVDEAKFFQVFGQAVNERKEKRREEPLVVRVRGSFQNIPKTDIIYAENAGRKIALHTRNDMIEYYEKMQDLEQQLGPPFFRCHRGYLVNLGQIKSYDNRNIVLKNGEVILMAKQKYQEFVSAYMNFLRRKKI